MTETIKIVLDASEVRKALNDAINRAKIQSFHILAPAIVAACDAYEQKMKSNGVALRYQAMRAALEAALPHIITSASHPITDRARFEK